MEAIASTARLNPGPVESEYTISQRHKIYKSAYSIFLSRKTSHLMCVCIQIALIRMFPDEPESKFSHEHVRKNMKEFMNFAVKRSDTDNMGYAGWYPDNEEGFKLRCNVFIICILETSAPISIAEK